MDQKLKHWLNLKICCKSYQAREFLLQEILIPGSQRFESTIFSNNMIPLISLTTNFKPGCNPPLLDNVLTNSLENIKVAGVFENGVSHHHPIFCFFKDVIPKIEIVNK